MKDLDIIDLNQRISLDAANNQLFRNQLEKDSQFLAENGIIDYSLLLGVHHIDGELPPRPAVFADFPGHGSILCPYGL